MSVMRADATGEGADADQPAERRVRELARDAVVLMAFSAGVSAGVSLLLLLAYGVGR